MSKPVVAQILFSGLGGHASVVFSMLSADVNREWSDLLLFFGNEKLRAEHIAKCEQMGIPYAYVEKRPGLDLRSLSSVFSVLRKARPDAIILHSPPLIPLIWAFKKLYGVPVILVEHNSNNIKTRREWLMTEWSMKLANHVVYLTPQYRDEVKARLKNKFEEKKVTVIPNGIDLDVFTPSDVRHERVMISMAGRFVASKDQLTLLRAFARVYKKYPLIRLVLAGDGSTFTQVQEEARKEGVGEVVEFAGMLDENGVADLLKRTDIYVHSTLSETMSTSIMQAMALGLPVISTDIEGVRNMIANGVNGILVPPKEIDMMADAIEKLLVNTELADSLGSNAHNHAVEKFSHVRMFNEYDKLVHESLKS